MSANGGEPREASHGSINRWTILSLLMALCFISHFNRANITTAADEQIMGQYGLLPSQMGWIYSAYLLIYTIFMIPGGLFIDRVGTRRALFLMVVGSAFFGALTGAMGWFAANAFQLWVSLLVVRSFMGFCTTPLHPGCARSVTEWFPEKQRSFANGLVTCAALMAYASVHPVFGKLIDHVGWQTALIISGAVGIGIGLAWRVCVGGQRSVAAAETTKRESQSFSLIFRNRSLLLLTVSYAAVGYFQYLFFYWMHYYFEKILHLADSRFWAGLPSLAMALSMPFGGWLTDHAEKRLGRNLGRVCVPLVGMILSALLLVSGLIAREHGWIIISFTASLAVLGLCEAAFWTTAVELGGRRGGAAAAFMNTGGNGIGLLAPILTPAIAEQFKNWAVGISLGAAVGIIGGLCWIWIRPPSEPKTLDAVAMRS